MVPGVSGTRTCHQRDAAANKDPQQAGIPAISRRLSHTPSINGYVFKSLLITCSNKYGGDPSSYLGFMHQSLFYFADKEELLEHIKIAHFNKALA